MIWSVYKILHSEFLEKPQGLYYEWRLRQTSSLREKKRKKEKIVFGFYGRFFIISNASTAPTMKIETIMPATATYNLVCS